MPRNHLQKISGWMEQHPRRFFFLLTLSRLALLPGRVYLLFHLPYNSEYRYWWEAMRYFTDQGVYPYFHYWSEYPPLFPWMMVGLDRLSHAFLSGQYAQICFYLLMGLVLVAAEMGSLALIYRIAQLTENTAAIRAALLFALFFLPMYLWTGWWDYIPVLAILMAFYLFVRGRDSMSAVLAGVGMFTKLFPVLMAPLAVCALPTWRRKVTYGTVALITTTLLVLPFGLTNPTGLANPAMTRASFQNMVTRPSWETIWALLDQYYSYGVVAGFPERFDPAQALTANHASQLPWNWVTGAFGVLFAGFYLRFGIWRIQPRGRPYLKLIAALGASITFLLLYSKGYSPQYLMWVAPLAAILFPHRKGAVTLGLLLLTNLVDLPIYITFFPDQIWMLWVAVLVRTVLFIGLAWAFAKKAIPSGKSSQDDEDFYGKLEIR